MPAEMRTVFTRELIAMAEADERIVLLDADLMRAHGTFPFRDKFPQRTFDMGVAEAGMVSTAAGLSSEGFIPFAMSFACFASRRAYNQFFVSANYARLNVKLVGSDPGISALLNGGLHMAFEDMGLMRNIPGCVVFEPADGVSLRALMLKSAEYKGSTYMRLHRKAVPDIYDGNETFELGRGMELVEGGDVSIIAAGPIMIPNAVEAARILRKDGISAGVMDMHTIKPLDEQLVLKTVRKTGAVLTCENHQIVNGLGSAVAELLSEQYPLPMKRLGIRDEFGVVGDLEFLVERFGLSARHIVMAAKELLNFKSKGRG